MPDRMKPCRLLALALSAALCARGADAPPDAPVMPVTMRVDAKRELGELKPIWRFFGCDEPNYATMKDGRRLLGELGELGPGNVYFRSHNLLCTGDGTPAYKWGSTNIYSEDEQGRPVYSWTLVDGIFDTYLARGVRPYAQIGFMPKALSTHPEPYQHEWRPGVRYDALGTGWSYPPTDYRKWSELVYQWVRHCVARYGAAEVERWYWETWNEPNLPVYWHGSPEEFFKLHDFAVDAVRRALPAARIGGPDMAGSGGDFMEKFLAHCAAGVNYATGARGTPTDFISFHAKGQPGFVDGHVQLGIAPELAGIDRGFATIAGVPAFKDKPIVIGECDPDGCAACIGPQLGYRTGTMYSSYTAASFGRIQTLADRRGVNVAGALTWAFEFEDQPFFAGQRVLATNGIDLPVLNVFRLFSRMGGRRLFAESSGQTGLDEIMRSGVRAAADIGAFASRDDRRVWVLVWHYHDDDVPGPSARVRLELAGLAGAARPRQVARYRVDADHGNAFSAWRAMGSPVAPNDEQYARLRAAGALPPPEMTPTSAGPDGGVVVDFDLPRQAVNLLVFEP